MQVEDVVVRFLRAHHRDGDVMHVAPIPTRPKPRGAIGMVTPLRTQDWGPEQCVSRAIGVCVGILYLKVSSSRPQPGPSCSL